MLTIQIEAHTELSAEVAIHIAAISARINELDRAQTVESLHSKLDNQACLILLAYVEGELAGFKIGYQLDNQRFYSWLGGVDADFRQLGLAKSMLEYQEKWATEQGYQRLEVKTRNQFNAMLTMLVTNQYHITQVESATDSADNKLFLHKELA
ncbi:MULTISPECIES: GNAT family N-acetyltransferase [unclassified Shewanella]|uniref:GNAT family N-acetyltransferase n=1 Tax=unclassified Shewanella TaxID=196818 RepID=UPI000C843FC5|nr:MULTISPECIES: GNAT family N-acetyltransferase [unclassified Shewanella]MDO6639535.1 GNAT family N-acetyltransferase [Shewanella sp. 5_MG-2023]MDO6775152.1 GNAT family N-acetyltransferase [Shewanella sp. 3_MG-2023]PMG30524.1 GNAT family N-acetyltransferase [Shewanella sp. 10N.286.52.C2]PMG52438.1 GNAT family N-acetyltransferase [Shewanella sp. 10N.286.52.B9]PMH98250.1 GNAT family N-acetyltransferase [Shewanella sp. 10N.286.48.A6]